MERSQVIRRADIWATALCFLAAAPLQAGALKVRTTAGATAAWSGPTSLDAALGFANRRTAGAGLRFMWTPSAGPFRFEVHSALKYSKGGNVAYATAIAPFLPTPPPASFFNLTQTWTTGTNTLATNRIDRLNVSFTTPSVVVKLGRQAITWGGGTVFHPADIVAPFSPNATDTAYKTGADMLNLQYLFESGADAQLIALPRAATIGGPADFNSSTYALRGRGALGGVDVTLMLARDRGDSVANLGLSGSLGGASWNAEYVGWQLAGGNYAPSMLFNISNFGTIFGRNLAYFGEVYHNGFGVGSATTLVSLPASLTKRLSTGQVFYTGTDFLAIGARLQITPDLTVSPSSILSLNDHSALMGLAVDYSLSDTTNLVFNYFRPLGKTGTEFGGRETSAGSGIYAAPAETVSLKVVRFF